MDRKELIEKARELLACGALSKEAADAIKGDFPELKESEGERIRKEIIRIVDIWTNSSPVVNGIPREKLLAYLEKQKDASKAIETVDRIDKYIDEHLANAHDMKDSNPDKKYYRGWDDALGEMARILQDVYSEEKQKEQKPIDPSDDELQRHQDELYDFKVFAAKQAKEHYISFVHDFEWNNFCEGILSYFNEQKPAEWHPTHEQMVALNWAANGIDNNSPCAGDIKASLRSLYNDLRSKSIKPAEWSENFEENIRILLHDKLTWHSEDGSMSSTVFIDDKTLKDIISGIWFYVGKEALKYPNKELNVSEWSEEDEDCWNLIWDILDGPFKASKKACKKATDWFIRKCPKGSNPSVPKPKQEWGEEDEKKLSAVLYSISRYSGEQHLKTKGFKYVEISDWLKSIRPQSHWKPSEEQMKAMEEVRTIFHHHHLWDEINPILYDYEELMRDLYKLM